MDTKNLARGAAAFAVTAMGLLAGAVGLAAYAARRAAGADVGGYGDGQGTTLDRSLRQPSPAPANPPGASGTDPRPDVGGPGSAERPPQVAAAGTAAAGHAAPDQAGDAPATAFDRAPEQFRPDPTAVPTAEERETLRPATGPAPSLAADRGDLSQGPAEADR